jgi:hypothetical protein
VARVGGDMVCELCRKNFHKALCEVSGRMLESMRGTLSGRQVRRRAPPFLHARYYPPHPKSIQQDLVLRDTFAT